jgi:hypothetical protein
VTEQERLLDCLCYLASCQAATLESLPKSAPKSQRRRHTSLAKIALSFIEGQPAQRPSGPGRTMDRLSAAIEEHGA